LGAEHEPLFGRVTWADGERFTVEPLGASVPFELEGEPRRAGEWVRVEGLRREGRAWRCERVVVIAPSTGAEFPSPRGDWARLRRDGGLRIGRLAMRAQALRSIRRWFEEEGFLEIEAPLLVPSPGLELHLDAFPVGDRYLITSPEYQMKRLLAAGLPRIYSLGRSFRRGEAGPHHNPEFTMLEWYRAPASWEEIASDVERLCAAVVQALAPSTRIVYQGQQVDLAPPWERLSVREAVQKHAGMNLNGDEPVAELIRKGRAAGHRIPDGTTSWDDAFFTIFLDAVEPRLGRGRPTILYDWPAPLAALARKKPGDPGVVERFEAYAGGLELCNGFGELVDPVEQRERLEGDLAERRRRGLPEYPIDERFLAALVEGLPPCAGVALGVDRLVMLACDAPAIRDVSAFVVDEL
jgi:lysyl-tRNA synthetase class 2